MHIPKLLPCALLAAAFLSLPMQAQAPLEVDQTELAKHIDHHVPPVYPPIAKAARIQGEVVFQVNVSKAGHVESLKVLSGPAMLQQEATDCLKQWTFHPFLKDGVPVAAHGRYSIIFSLGSSPAPSTRLPAQVSASTPGAPSQTVVVQVKAETSV
jgi:TonB family protein